MKLRHSFATFPTTFFPPKIYFLASFLLSPRINSFVRDYRPQFINFSFIFKTKKSIFDIRDYIHVHLTQMELFLFSAVGFISRLKNFTWEFAIGDGEFMSIIDICLAFKSLDSRRCFSRNENKIYENARLSTLALNGAIRATAFTALSLHSRC